MSDRYAAVEAHRGQFPVRLMCRLLEVSTSGFYDAMARRASGARSARMTSDERLRVQVRAAHRKSRSRYGAPRVHAALRREGLATSRKRVARLMREDGLVGQRRRKFIRTTDSSHAGPIAPNLLARRFAPAEHPAPDRVWCGDLTYIPTREGWLYLAVLLDLATRRVVGWATGATMATALPLAALERALWLRQPSRGLIHHTDRGSQYASEEYRSVLARHGVAQSMSRKGDCWDNAVAESFFSTLEHELLDGAEFDSRGEAHRRVAEFIDSWYNVERLHSTLGYLSPVEYEERLGQQVSRAA